MMTWWVTVIFTWCLWQYKIVTWRVVVKLYFYWNRARLPPGGGECGDGAGSVDLVADTSSRPSDHMSSGLQMPSTDHQGAVYQSDLQMVYQERALPSWFDSQPTESAKRDHLASWGLINLPVINHVPLERVFCHRSKGSNHGWELWCQCSFACFFFFIIFCLICEGWGLVWLPFPCLSVC